MQRHSRHRLPARNTLLAEGKLRGEARAQSVYNFTHISLTRETTNPLTESLHPQSTEERHREVEEKDTKGRGRRKVQHLTFNSSVQCFQNLSPIHLAEKRGLFQHSRRKELATSCCYCVSSSQSPDEFSCLSFCSFPGPPEEIRIPCVVFQVLSGSGSSSSRLEE